MTSQAIVLAGGLGTRLRPAISDLPKAMAPIRGVPFIEILLSSLSAQGIEKVVVAAGFRAAQLVDHFRAVGDIGLDLSFHCEETPLGTGGAVYAALGLLDDEDVFIVNGDTFVEVDLVSFGAARAEKSAPVGMCLVESQDASRYGSVVLSDQGRVLSFVEKSPDGPGLINAGVYVLDRSALPPPPAPAPFSFERDVIRPLVQKGVVLGFVASGRFIDIGIPDDYYAAQQLIGDLALVRRRGSNSG